MTKKSRGYIEVDDIFEALGKFDRFSSGRLIALLSAIGCDMELRVTPAPRRRAGRFTVKAA